MINYYLQEKKCSKCEKTKYFIDFSMNKSTVCKQCTNEDYKKRRLTMGSQDKNHSFFNHMKKPKGQNEN